MPKSRLTCAQYGPHLGLVSFPVSRFASLVLAVCPIRRLIRNLMAETCPESPNLDNIAIKCSAQRSAAARYGITPRGQDVPMPMVPRRLLSNGGLGGGRGAGVCLETT